MSRKRSLSQYHPWVSADTIQLQGRHKKKLQGKRSHHMDQKKKKKVNTYFHTISKHAVQRFIACLQLVWCCFVGISTGSKYLIPPTPQTLHSDKICSNIWMAAVMFPIGHFCNPKRSSISRAAFALWMGEITFWRCPCLSTNQDKALPAVILAEMHPHPDGTLRWFPWARLQVGGRRTAVTALSAAQFPASLQPMLFYIWNI